MNQIIPWVPPLHSTNTFQHWQLNQCYATAVVQLTIGFICLPIIRDAAGGFAVRSYQRSFCLVSTIASNIFCHGATILSKSFHIFCKLLQATRWTVMCVVLLQHLAVACFNWAPLQVSAWSWPLLEMPLDEKPQNLTSYMWPVHYLPWHGKLDIPGLPRPHIASSSGLWNNQQTAAATCSICIVTRAVAQNQSRGQIGPVI